MAGMWSEVSTLGDLVVRGAALHPERDAIVFYDRAITYRELLAGAEEVARGLVGIGVERGQHVGILVNNSPELVFAMFGIALRGAVAVPLNTRNKGAELQFIIENAELVALLTSRAETSHIDFAELLAGVRRGDRLRHIVCLAGTAAPSLMGPDEFRTRAKDVDPAAVERVRRSVRVRETALVIYTSGTTANPKGCMLSHEAITRGPSERARRRLSVGDHDVTWAAGQLYHIGSLGPFIGSLGAAGTFLSDTIFDAGRALAMMARYRVTLAWPWFSAIVQALLDHPTFDGSQLSTLRHLFIIASPTLVRRTIAALPHAEILQGCGMTETAGVFALSEANDDIETRAITQGKPWDDVDIRIRAIDGDSDEARGVVGEVLVRGPCVMDGYFRDPRKTAEALDDAGWLHTGDLYAHDPDGNLVFHGRLKDMLKVGGENVAALEVESFLCAHPAVKIAEVVGRPDARLDEVPVAFVEIRKEMTVTEEDLIAFWRGQIANYKVPRAIFFMEESDWPMSATKVDKRALRSRLQSSHNNVDSRGD